MDRKDAPLGQRIFQNHDYHFYRHNPKLQVMRNGPDRTTISIQTYGAPEVTGFRDEKGFSRPIATYRHDYLKMARVTDLHVVAMPDLFWEPMPRPELDEVVE